MDRNKKRDGKIRNIAMAFIGIMIIVALSGCVSKSEANVATSFCEKHAVNI